MDVFVLAVLMWTCLETRTSATLMKESIVYVNDTMVSGSFPQEITMSIFSDDFPEMHLIHLQKFSVNPDIPVFVVCKDGNSICPRQSTKENVAYYENIQNASTLSVIQKTMHDGTTHNLWSGSISIEDTVFDIELNPLSTFPQHNYIMSVSPILNGPPDLLTLTPEEIQTLQHNISPYSRKRKKRQTTVLKIGLLVVVDNIIYNTWFKASKADTTMGKMTDAESNIRRYFANVVNGVDLRYRAIQDSRFSISVTLVGYIIAPNEVTQPSFMSSSSRSAVDADVTLAEFRKWVRQLDGLPTNDHVTLFTGNDLYTIKDGVQYPSVTGLAYFGLICTEMSLSLVEYHGGYSSTRIAAHEIGHSLGASHDGAQNTCNSADQYIMTGKAEPTQNKAIRTNPWHFSQCSLDAFAYTVDLLKNTQTRQCLFDTPTVFNKAKFSEYIDKHPGQQLTIDETCRQFLGTSSYMCRDLLDSPEEICTSLWCHRTNTTQCRQHISPRGTSCGSSKWCIDGNCIYNSNAPKLPDNCVHGSHPGVVHNGMTCNVLVNSEPYYCYQSFVQKRCCSECRKYYRPYSGCEYGNRQQKCPVEWCDHQGDQREEILRQCCKTCGQGTLITTTMSKSSITTQTTESKFTATRTKPKLTTSNTNQTSSRRPSVTIHGGCVNRLMNCLETANSNPSLCYTSDFVNDCCYSCKMIRSNNSECYYGDWDRTTCMLTTRENCVTNKTTKLNCCYTCGNLNATMPGGDGTQLRFYRYSFILSGAILFFLHGDILTR